MIYKYRIFFSFYEVLEILHYVMTERICAHVCYSNHLFPILCSGGLNPVYAERICGLYLELDQDICKATHAIY